MILNRDGLVWVGRRIDTSSVALGRGQFWQMPQGGVDEGEDVAAAVRREVQEETGMTSIDILAQLPGTHLYDLPPALLAQQIWGGKYRGQSQTWFALRFLGDDAEVAISPLNGPAPEFDAWRWAHPSELLDVIVPFKRNVYQAVLADAQRLGVLAD